jgi:hypothetical protein
LVEFFTGQDSKASTFRSASILLLLRCKAERKR